MTNIKNEIANGAFYYGIAKYSGIAFQIIISAILARLLSPSDFGLIAIATVVMTFFNLLSDVGISSAIVQKKELSNYDIEHIFTFTIYLGVFLCLSFFCLSWPISFFYKNSDLLPVCQCMSLLLIFSCSRIVPMGLVMKNKEFKFQSLTSLFANMLGGGLACLAAFVGFGVYSLLITFFVPSIVTFVLFYKKYPARFCFHIDVNPLKHIFSYSAYVFLFNVVNYFSRNLDKLLIGKYISMSDLGQYQKSYNLMIMPLNNISDVITPVLHPVFSEFQNDISFIKQRYFKLLNMLAYISFSLSVFLYFVSNEAILIVYGDNWIPAIRPFQILSLTVSTQMLLASAGSIFQAINATKNFFISGCLCSLFMITGFVVSIYLWGTIEAVSWGFLFAQLFNTISSFSILCYSLKANLQEFLSVLSRPFIVSIIICMIFYLLSFVSLQNIVASFIVKLIVYLISLALFMSYLSHYNVFRIISVYINEKRKVKK